MSNVLSAGFGKGLRAATGPIQKETVRVIPGNAVPLKKAVPLKETVRVIPRNAVPLKNDAVNLEHLVEHLKHSPVLRR